MESPSAIFPIWVTALDNILGLVMWTLIGRVAMNIFLPENSNSFFREALRPLDRSPDQSFPPGYDRIPDPAAGAALCGLVHFHVSVLSDALAVGIFGNGNAVVPARRRGYRDDLQDILTES